jgi:hypothetical protein
MSEFVLKVGVNEDLLRPIGFSFVEGVAIGATVLAPDVGIELIRVPFEYTGSKESPIGTWLHLNHRTSDPGQGGMPLTSTINSTLPPFL